MSGYLENFRPYVKLPSLLDIAFVVWSSLWSGLYDTYASKMIWNSIYIVRRVHVLLSMSLTQLSSQRADPEHCQVVRILISYHHEPSGTVEIEIPWALATGGLDLNQFQIPTISNVYLIHCDAVVASISYI